jgi:hypothetical protein
LGKKTDFVRHIYIREYSELRNNRIEDFTEAILEQNKVNLEKYFILYIQPLNLFSAEKRNKPSSILCLNDLKKNLNQSPYSIFLKKKLFLGKKTDFARHIYKRVQRIEK